MPQGSVLGPALTSFINLFSVMLFRAAIISIIIIDIIFMLMILSFILFLKQMMHLWSKTRLKAVFGDIFESQMI